MPSSTFFLKKLFLLAGETGTEPVEPLGLGGTESRSCDSRGVPQVAPPGLLSEPSDVVDAFRRCNGALPSWAGVGAKTNCCPFSFVSGSGLTAVVLT